MTAVAERIPIVDRARRQPRLRVDRRAVALGRRRRLRHPLPRRRTGRCRSTRRTAPGRSSRCSRCRSTSPPTPRASARACIRARDDRRAARRARRRARRRRARSSIHVEVDRYAGVPELRELVGRARSPRSPTTAAVRRRARPTSAPRARSGSYLERPMSDLLVHPAARRAGRHASCASRPSRPAGATSASRCSRSPPARSRERDTGDREVLRRRRRRHRARALRARRVARPRRPRRPVRRAARRRLPAAGHAASTLEGAGDGARSALCFAPAPGGGAAARVLPGADDRGRDARARRARAHDPPDPDGRPGGRLAAGLRGAHARPGTGRATRRTSTTATSCPTETLLEETYYHRVAPAHGLRAPARLHRRPHARRDADAFGDRDCVLVPRGYHTVSAPPGYDALLPERDGRPDPRLGRRQRPRPRMDAAAMTAAPSTATRLLDNYVGGAWTPAPRPPRRSTSPTPRPARCSPACRCRARADLDAAVRGRARGAAGLARGQRRSSAPAGCSRCASASSSAARTSPAR